MNLPECNLPICPQPDEHRIQTGRCIVVMTAATEQDLVEPNRCPGVEPCAHFRAAIAAEEPA